MDRVGGAGDKGVNIPESGFFFANKGRCWIEMTFCGRIWCSFMIIWQSATSIIQWWRGGI